MWTRQKVFSYSDGATVRWADPLEIDYALSAALGGEVNKTLADARSKNPVVAYEAHQKLIPAIRKAFNLPEVNPETNEGCSWRDCIEVLNEFVKWEEALKKNGATEPMSSPVSVGPTVSACHTPTSLDCGSISSEPIGDSLVLSSGG